MLQMLLMSKHCLVASDVSHFCQFAIISRFINIFLYHLWYSSLFLLLFLYCIITIFSIWLLSTKREVQVVSGEKSNEFEFIIYSLNRWKYIFDSLFLITKYTPFDVFIHFILFIQILFIWVLKENSYNV